MKRYFKHSENKAWPDVDDVGHYIHSCKGSLEFFQKIQVSSTSNVAHTVLLILGNLGQEEHKLLHSLLLYDKNQKASPMTA